MPIRRLVAALLFDVSATDPAVFGAVMHPLPAAAPGTGD